jgi:hypothetical protein
MGGKGSDHTSAAARMSNGHEVGDGEGCIDAGEGDGKDLKRVHAATPQHGRECDCG